MLLQLAQVAVYSKHNHRLIASIWYVKQIMTETSYLTEYQDENFTATIN